MNSWEEMCEATGFCDFYYKRTTKPPGWMSKKEIQLFANGVVRAQKLIGQAPTERKINR